MGILDGKIILVTGAAGGIGKECALLAAREGAAVIVNDLGGSVRGGDGGDAGPAEETAREIRDAGGKAVANGADITDAAAVRDMVEQAKSELGGLHVVMNTAGILRDKMFHKLEEEDWHLLVNVHLNGAYNVTRATIEHFREQGDGNYVHFTSTSGLIGAIGQSNYAAAKMGVTGLSRVIALEGEAKGVRSNVIAPFAWSRMIATIPVKDDASALRVKRMQEGMRPEQVAQLAIALAAPGAGVSGQVFGARGNELILFSQPRPVRSLSHVTGWTPQAIIDQAFAAMRPAFSELVPTTAIFPYDPV